MLVVSMVNYAESACSKSFGLLLLNALEVHKEIILDFSGVNDCDLCILKELLKSRRKCLEQGAVIKIANAPEGLELIVLTLNITNDNLVLI